jgi:hypothetical protein
MRKIIEEISLDIDVDDIIRKETHLFYTILAVSLSLDLSRTA